MIDADADVAKGWEEAPATMTQGGLVAGIGDKEIDERGTALNAPADVALARARGRVGAVAGGRGLRHMRHHPRRVPGGGDGARLCLPVVCLVPRGDGPYPTEPAVEVQPPGRVVDPASRQRPQVTHRVASDEEVGGDHLALSIASADLGFGVGRRVADLRSPALAPLHREAFVTDADVDAAARVRSADESGAWVGRFRIPAARVVASTVDALGRVV